MTLSDKPTMTQTRVFKDDTAKIQKLADILEHKEKARFNSEHVVNRALLALAEKLAA